MCNFIMVYTYVSELSDIHVYHEMCTATKAGASHHVYIYILTGRKKTQF